MSSEKRKYELRARAERQRRTRQRIVEATVGLHQDVGPARTTVAEIARRAGVTRLTVYNNFPDEKGLFAACQAHWLADHPPPDPAAAFAIHDSRERLQAILRGLYAWYRENREIVGNSQRDRSVLPALDALLAETVDAQLAGLAEALVGGWTPPPGNSDRLRAVVALALDVATWQRLDGLGADEEWAAELMADLVACATRPRGDRRR
jgi:AcrR family transcriptional regulator